MGWVPSRYVSRYRGKNGMEYQLICPSCRKDNLWYNSTRQSGQCFTCPGNSRSGNLQYSARDLRLRFDGLSSSVLDDALADIILNKRVRPEVIQHPYQEHWQAVWYLEKVRRLIPDDITRAHIWYDSQRDRVCIPIQSILNEQPAISPYMSRIADPEAGGWMVQPKEVDKEQFWFMPAPIVSPYLVLVEGAFDVLTPGLLGKGIALLGTKLYEDAIYWLIERQPRIVLWMDPDEPGRRASKHIMEALGGICPIVEIDYEKEAGDCTPGEADEVIRVALGGIKV